MTTLPGQRNASILNAFVPTYARYTRDVHSYLTKKGEAIPGYINADLTTFKMFPRAVIPYGDNTTHKLIQMHLAGDNVIPDFDQDTLSDQYVLAANLDPQSINYDVDGASLNLEGLAGNQFLNPADATQLRHYSKGMQYMNGNYSSDSVLLSHAKARMAYNNAVYQRKLGAKATAASHQTGGLVQKGIISEKQMKMAEAFALAHRAAEYPEEVNPDNTLSAPHPFPEEHVRAGLDFALDTHNFGSSDDVPDIDPRTGLDRNLAPKDTSELVENRRAIRQHINDRQRAVRDRAEATREANTRFHAENVPQRDSLQKLKERREETLARIQANRTQPTSASVPIHKEENNDDLDNLAQEDQSHPLSKNTLANAAPPSVDDHDPDIDDIDTLIDQVRNASAELHASSYRPGISSPSEENQSTPRNRTEPSAAPELHDLELPDGSHVSVTYDQAIQHLKDRVNDRLDPNKHYTIPEDAPKEEIARVLSNLTTRANSTKGAKLDDDDEDVLDQGEEFGHYLYIKNKYREYEDLSSIDPLFQSTPNTTFRADGTPERALPDLSRILSPASPSVSITPARLSQAKLRPVTILKNGPNKGQFDNTLTKPFEPLPDIPLDEEPARPEASQPKPIEKSFSQIRNDVHDRNTEGLKEARDHLAKTVREARERTLPLTPVQTQATPPTPLPPATEPTAELPQLHGSPASPNPKRLNSFSDNDDIEARSDESLEKTLRMPTPPADDDEDDDPYFNYSKRDEEDNSASFSSIGTGALNLFRSGISVGATALNLAKKGVSATSSALGSVSRNFRRASTYITPSKSESGPQSVFARSPLPPSTVKRPRFSDADNERRFSNGPGPIISPTDRKQGTPRAKYTLPNDVFSPNLPSSSKSPLGTPPKKVLPQIPRNSPITQSETPLTLAQQRSPLPPIGTRNSHPFSTATAIQPTDEQVSAVDTGPSKTIVASAKANLLKPKKRIGADQRLIQENQETALINAPGTNPSLQQGRTTRSRKEPAPPPTAKPKRGSKRDSEPRSGNL